MEILKWVLVYILGASFLGVLIGRLTLMVWKHPGQWPVLQYLLCPGISPNGNYRKVGIDEHVNTGAFPLIRREVDNAVRGTSPDRSAIGKYLILTAVFLPVRTLLTIMTYLGDIACLCIVVFDIAVEKGGALLAKHCARCITIK